MAIFNKSDFKFCSVPVPEINAHKGADFDFTEEQISSYGQSQTHPSILYSPTRFGGHDFWLACTPYPKAVGVFENPCVYYADFQSGYTPPVLFTPISGTANGNYNIISNPVVKVIENYALNSDPDLFIKGSKMYLVSRNNNAMYKSVVQESIDGQAWTTRNTSALFMDYPEKISPAFLVDGDIIRAYAITGEAGIYSYSTERNRGRFKGVVVYEGTTVENGGNLVYTKKADIAGAREVIHPWHFDVIKHENTYYMVCCAKDISRNINGNSYMFLYLAKSDDGMNFKIYREPLFDSYLMYRPTLCIINGTLVIYASTTDVTGVTEDMFPRGAQDISTDGRYIGLLYGNLDDILSKLESYE